MAFEEVILVTNGDEYVGTMEKMEAHRRGVLHRAFSVFIFSPKGEMLLQKRAARKYHGALLWSNACCSHPRPEEDIQTAAHRRLAEELGFSTRLEKIFAFTYKSDVENGLIEHEYDHVFCGEYEGIIAIDKDEVEETAYTSINEIKQRIWAEPNNFTSWFRIVFPRIEEWWRQKYESVKTGV